MRVKVFRTNIADCARNMTLKLTNGTFGIDDNRSDGCKTPLGFLVVMEFDTQGALRDPGLWSETPLA